MIRLNTLQNPVVLPLLADEKITLNPIKNNKIFEDKKEEFLRRFGFENLNTFKFNSEGVLSLLLSLKGKILVSLGESENLINGAKLYKSLGFDLEFIPLTKEGGLEYEKIVSCDYVFASSYVMDTYVKVDLQEVKKRSGAKLISNISATLDSSISDMVILDAFKLTGYSLDSLILYTNEFKQSEISQTSSLSLEQIEKSCNKFKVENSIKKKFLETLKGEFKDNIFFFVSENSTLAYTLHFGLKGIKAREIIRTLALDEILVTNGEGCSLGLSKPSRILQEMGYKEEESRWALSLNFDSYISDEDIEKIVKKMAKKYRQIIALNS